MYICVKLTLVDSYTNALLHFPDASGQKKVNSNLIKSIRSYLIGSSSGSKGECKHSFTREKKTKKHIAAQQDRLISMMKCSGGACCYYPSGCYCPKPRTGNEMIYDALVSRQGVCVLEWVWVDVPFKRGASVRHHLPVGGYNGWWDCVWEKIYLCLPCTLAPHPP